MEGFEKIYIDKKIEGHPVSKRIISNLSGEIIPVADIQKIKSNEGENEKILILTRHEGRLVKRCPGTKNHICCNYHVINQVLGCDIGCTYCILKGYINAPGTVINVNIEDTFEKIEKILSRPRKYIYRVGTGELADSFYLDDITRFAETFVEFFSTKRGVLFELKTKSDRTDSVLGLNHNGKTIVSWSLNAPSQAASEEGGAPDVFRRLDAARRASEAGYFIGFHFDPIIYFDNWEEEYRQVARAIFDYVDPKKILWISLGTLRYPPFLHNIIRERHPKSKIVCRESFPGDDNKMRYLKPLRVKIYREVARAILGESPGIFIYLCMERKDVWGKVFGAAPENNAQLDRMFHEMLKEKWLR